MPTAVYLLANCPASRGTVPHFDDVQTIETQLGYFIENNGRAIYCQNVPHFGYNKLSTMEVRYVK